MQGYHQRLGNQGHWGDVTCWFRPDAEMLDVGCGTGWLADHFVHYTGLESSPEAVKIAADAGRTVKLGDIEDPLPFADATFDGVIIKDVLEHVTNPASLVGEVRRVLRPGGLVYASSPDAQRWVWIDYTHRRPFPRQAMNALFTDQGFDIDRLGYQSIIPGSGIVANWTSSHRRPLPFRLAARVPWLRRNTFVVAHR